METFFFWLFAGSTVASGLIVISQKNPVAAALFLVLSMLCLAGLFVTLNAFLLAAVQVLVYAGAVLVLFLFTIMLLDLKTEKKKKIRFLGIVSGACVGALFLGAMLTVLGSSPQGEVTVKSLPAEVANDVPVLGQLLFTRYVLPFEVIGLLLLVAIIGVVLLSKRNVP
jgi:NADH-quinone oxidoreductase subunit J